MISRVTQSSIMGQLFLYIFKVQLTNSKRQSTHATFNIVMIQTNHNTSSKRGYWLIPICTYYWYCSRCIIRMNHQSQQIRKFVRWNVYLKHSYFIPLPRLYSSWTWLVDVKYARMWTSSMCIIGQAPDFTKVTYTFINTCSNLTDLYKNSLLIYPTTVHNSNVRTYHAFTL